jgi:hypothetical protein
MLTTGLGGDGDGGGVGACLHVHHAPYGWSLTTALGLKETRRNVVEGSNTEEAPVKPLSAETTCGGSKGVCDSV